MSPMSESKYPLNAHTERNANPQPSQDLTPYSAVCFRNCCFPFWTLQEQSVSDQQYQVSSFNLPTYCDSSLITPVTLVGKIEPLLPTDSDIKLSPSTMSASAQFLQAEEDYVTERYYHNPPMKHKGPSAGVHMSTWDSSFPESPLVHADPFFGPYSVSATSVSGRSDSPPRLNPSPTHMHSAGGFSNASLSPNIPSAAGARHPPRLIAPSPSTLRSATKQEAPYRQSSVQSTSKVPSSATIPQKAFPEASGPLPPKGKKRKSLRKDTRKLNRENIILRDDKTEHEKILLDLTLNQPHRWQWNDVVNRFYEKTGERLSVATLQMREKRAIARLRIWTEDDVISPFRRSQILFLIFTQKNALALAVKEFNRNKWETISDKMMEHGCVAQWSKEACERKWREMHPEEEYIGQYEVSMQHRDSEDWAFKVEARSDGGASVCHSFPEVDSGVQMSAISTPTMEEVRSRATSDASSQMLHMRSQRRQQHIMFDEQQRQNGWGIES